MHSTFVSNMLSNASIIAVGVQCGFLFVDIYVYFLQFFSIFFVNFLSMLLKASGSLLADTLSFKYDLMRGVKINSWQY